MSMIIGQISILQLVDKESYSNAVNSWYSLPPFAGQIANNFSPFITIRGGTTFAIDGKEGVGSYKEKWGKCKNTLVSCWVCW